MASDTNNGKRIWLFALITTLFFFWGLANNMTGVLQEAFGHIMDISPWQTMLIESAFYAAYLVFAIPATYFIFRYSYKNTVMLGLMLYSVGAMLFFPAANAGSPYLYIIAIYVMAGGCTILETVANPYILSLGQNHRDSVRKLNLAQSFNPLGSITGILIGQSLITNNLIFSGADANIEIMHEQLDAITIIYAVLGEVLIVFLVALMFTSMPVSRQLASEGRRTWADLWESLCRISKSKRLLGGAVAIFMYVGAQSGVWGYITKVSQGAGGISTNPASVLVWAMVAFCVARFVFTALMRKTHHHKLLLIAAVSAILLCLLVVFGSGLVVTVAMVLVSAMMSLMFPTIFGSALEKAGADTQTGSALLVMSIVGGALILPAQNYLTDHSDAQMSFIVPALCFMAIAGYAAGLMLASRKK